MRRLGCRLSRHGRHPGGFYLFDEGGEVAASAPFGKDRPRPGRDWQRIDLQLAGVELAQVCFDKTVGCLDVLYVLMFGRDSANEQHAKSGGWILGTQRDGWL